MLQWVLPCQVRSEIIDRLFQEVVTKDEAAFAQKLYLSVPEMREMKSSGMEIGGHGYGHVWLGELSVEERGEEIRRTKSFLGTLLGQPLSEWVMCYPYGSYNAATLRLLAESGCALGLTTKTGIASLAQPLELNRLDTNDIPVTRHTGDRASDRVIL